MSHWLDEQRKRPLPSIKNQEKRRARNDAFFAERALQRQQEHAKADESARRAELHRTQVVADTLSSHVGQVVSNVISSHMDRQFDTLSSMISASVQQVCLLTCRIH